jgi:hypothetical protein
MYDNGAYSNWKTGKPTDWKRYYAFLELNMNVHIDWSVIPDAIDGSEEQNDLLLRQWPLPRALGAPVWHLHESFYRLHNLAYAGYIRICFGSSGKYSVIGDSKWMKRVELAFDLLCPNGGQPPVAIHMLRGLSQASSIFPFASADSTNFARNHKRYGSTHDKMDFVNGIDGANCKKDWVHTSGLVNTFHKGQCLFDVLF